MQAWGEKLVELQDIDLKIAKLELQLGELPKRQAEAELQYKAEADALAAATNDLKQAEVAAKALKRRLLLRVKRNGTSRPRPSPSRTTTNIAPPSCRSR